MKWTCIGVKEQLEKIKNFLVTSKRRDKNFVAFKSLRELDTTITALLTDSDNDFKSLMTYRRQVRQLLKSID